MEENKKAENQETEKNNGQSQQSPNKEKEVDDNDVQRGLTGETDDEEDVGGDLAGNAGGNT
ncbi:hypothetical protein [Pedobacter miscanthi]|uniref:Uncharacterized protein n=1 Tax=Pedobacter miscanthi TaxID=2259170 RepID=A0A366LDA7_9SPHI|nr:hypothetical protein [Pedobacter miscanthi]RBQ11836.1 hypothetical protein DRW42_00735 [Pedobacter miscanthi]